MKLFIIKKPRQGERYKLSVTPNSSIPDGTPPYLRRTHPNNETLEAGITTKGRCNEKAHEMVAFRKGLERKEGPDEPEAAACIACRVKAAEPRLGY
jgi:hypothetical protein